MLRLIPSELLVEVRQHRRAEPDSPIVIVESWRDQRVLHKFVQGRTLVIPADGCDNVRAVVRLSAAELMMGVVGVVDADDRVLSTRDDMPNIVTGNHRDLEGMLFDSPAFHQCVVELKNGPVDIAFADVMREKIYQAALPLGILRYVSRRDKLRLAFPEQRAQDVLKKTVSAKTLEVDVVGTVHGFVREATLRVRVENAVRAILNASPNALRFCNGHDLVWVLSMVTQFGAFLGCRVGATVMRVEDCLRLAYPREHFLGTELFSNLRVLTIAQPPFLLFGP